MAEDRKKEKDSEEESESSKSAPAKKGAGGMGGLMLPMMIVCIVIGLSGLGLGGYFLFSNMQAAKAAPEEVTDEEAVPTEEVPTETNIFFEEFPEGIVNLAVAEDSVFTYLKYGISIEVDAEPTVEKIEEMLPRLTSKVSEIMSNRSWAEISMSTGREQLAREVLAGVNDELSEGECIGIYFTTFVAQ